MFKQGILLILEKIGKGFFWLLERESKKLDKVLAILAFIFSIALSPPKDYLSKLVGKTVAYKIYQFASILVPIFWFGAMILSTRTGLFGGSGVGAFVFYLATFNCVNSTLHSWRELSLKVKEEAIEEIIDS